MRENLHSLAKEVDFQEVQEAQRVPKKLYPRKNTPKHIIIKLPKIKDKERILKAAKGEFTTKEFHMTMSWFLRKKLAGKKELESSIPSLERQGPTH